MHVSIGGGDMDISQNLCIVDAQLINRGLHNNIGSILREIAADETGIFGKICDTTLKAFLSCAGFKRGKEAKGRQRANQGPSGFIFCRIVRNEAEVRKNGFRFMIYSLS